MNEGGKNGGKFPLDRFERDNASTWEFRMLPGCGKDGCGETEGLLGAEGPSQVLDGRIDGYREKDTFFCREEGMVRE